MDFYQMGKEDRLEIEKAREQRSAYQPQPEKQEGRIPGSDIPKKKRKKIPVTKKE